MKAKPFFFILLFAIVMAIANQWHVISQWFANPREHLFTGIAHYYADYFLYTDVFAQGARGSIFSTQTHFTNEPMGSTWIYWLNALLGFIGGLVGLNPFATYNVSLFLFVVLLVCTWYFVTGLFFPHHFYKRIEAVIFIVTASSFFSLPRLIKTGGIEVLGQFWFSPTPALNRLGGVPHQVFQTITLLVTLYFYSHLFSKSTTRFTDWMIGTVGIVLISTANPIQAVIFNLSLLCMITLRSFKEKKLYKNLWIFCLYSIGLSVLLVVVTNASFSLPVLKAAKDWENNQTYVMPLFDFFLSIGPISILFLLGVYPVFKNVEIKHILYYLYGFLSFALYFSPVPRLLGTTNVRWLHPASYGVLGIVATYGLHWISSQCTSRSRQRLPYPMTTGIFLFMYGALTIPVLFSQIDSRSNSATNDVTTSQLNHIPLIVVDGLHWLSTQSNKKTPVTVTDPTLPYDVLVPTLTGKISFTGHPIHTLYHSVKESIRNELFSPTVSMNRAKQLFTDHRIGYVIVKTGSTPLFTTFSHVSQKFSNEKLTIYEVTL